MTLPPDFLLSQSSLQDYVDCPRRFYLRYVRRLAWPAIEAQPPIEHERHLQQGADFHHLVHQHELGIPAEELTSAVTDLDPRRWWRDYLEKRPSDLPEVRYPEVVLSAQVSDQRLIAKYDLIAVDVGRRAIILEWKTYRGRSRRTWLAGRLQTRVYRYLLVRAGSHLNEGEPFEAEQVEMIYWFANFPDDPESFPYDAAEYEADETYLTSLIEEIKGLREEEFPLTTEKERCQLCRYRSLCRRGDTAGDFREAEEEWELDDQVEITLDFEQIAEIEI